MKRPSRRLPILAACLLATLPAPAAFCSLGETIPQIAARYGKPVREYPPKGEGYLKEYRTPDYLVQVGFWNGRSCYEHYERADGKLLTGKEVQTFLAASGDGKSWTSAFEPSWALVWTRSDHAAYGYSNPNTRYLFLTTRKALKDQKDLFKDR